MRVAARNHDCNLDVLKHGAVTLTVDAGEEQTEQQTLQPRHRSCRCRHCMCEQRLQSSSTQVDQCTTKKTVATLGHAVQLQVTAAPKNYLHVEADSPGDRRIDRASANTRCLRHSAGAAARL